MIERYIGINIDGINDWTVDRMFANVVDQARFPGSVAAPWDCTAPLGPDGWPVADFGIVLVAGPESPGTYDMTFRGRADVSGSGTAVDVQGLKYDPATNTSRARLVVRKDQQQFNLGFRNTRRSPMSPDARAAAATGLTDVRIMRPTVRGGDTPHPAGTLFSTAFVRFLADFDVIRFMDYLSTNSNTSRKWSDRRTPRHMTQGNYGGAAGKPNIGACIEYAIMLCNQSKKDMWINIPCMVDDDYIRRVAQIILYGSDGVNPYAAAQQSPAYPPLDPARRVYAEYSNEVWNYGGGFAQSNQNDQLADTEVKAGPSSLSYDGRMNYGVTGKRRVARQAMNISNIFRDAFGDRAMMSRVRPLFEWQYNDANGTFSVGLEYINNYYNNADGVKHVPDPHPVNYFFYGGGGAWYAGVRNPAAASVDAIYASGQLNIGGLVAQEAAEAGQYGLPLCGYEGSFSVGTDSPTTLTMTANFDPRAEQATVDALTQFFANGGRVAMVYSSTVNNYSVVRSMDDLDTPKLRGIRRFRSAGFPVVTLGVMLPQPLVLPGRTGFFDPSPAVIGSYTLQATVPGDYSFAMVGNGPENGIVRAMVDGVMLPDPVRLTPLGYDPAYSVPIPFRVADPGIHVISFTNYGPGRIYVSGPAIVSVAGRVIRPGAATFAGSEIQTRGSWPGVYGSLGSYLPADTAQRPPTVADIRTMGSVWNYGATQDIRGQFRSNGQGRFSGTLYSPAAAIATVEITDNKSHKVTLYLCDWDSTVRHQRVDVLDGVSGALLDSRDVAAFHGGMHMSWNVTGSVRLAARNLNPAMNAVINGIFID